MTDNLTSKPADPSDSNKKEVFVNTLVGVTTWSFFSTFIGSMLLARAAVDYIGSGHQFTTSILILTVVGITLAFLPIDTLFLRRQRAVLKDNPYKDAFKNKTEGEPVGAAVVSVVLFSFLLLLFILAMVPVFIVTLLHLLGGNVGFTNFFWLFTSSAFGLSLIVAEIKKKIKKTKAAE